MNTELTCPANTSATADSLDGAAWCAAGRMLSILVVAHQTTAPLIRKLFHVAGLHFLFTTLATGGTYVVDGPGDAALFPNPFDIVEHPDAGRSLDTIRLAFSQQTSEALVQSFPGVTCATPYGATELGGTALVAFGDDCVRRGPSLDDRCLGMVAAVLDDNDEPVRTARSVSCVSGGRRRRLDWNLPDASAELLRNGWLHTGDLGREDRDGLIFFVDRQKDMVKPGGENVYSIEVEAVLTSHPAVVECAVIGVPDDRWGEAVKAVVVARGDVTAEELDRWCLDRLAAFKRPRWYDFVAGLPRNASAKVVKPDLRAGHDPATSTRLPERT